MSKQFRLLNLTEARAMKLTGLTAIELRDVHEAARAVANEIVYDLVDLYKNKQVPRFAMIECVIDCDRLAMKLQERSYPPPEQRDVAINKLQAVNQRTQSLQIMYSVVGMELGPGEVYCV